MIRPYLEQWIGNDETRIATLSDKAVLHVSTIERILSGQMKVVSFNVADRLLCSVNAVQAWHKGELGVIYQTISLDHKGGPLGERNVCARVGCSEKVVLKKGGHGKKYCCRDCMRAMSLERLGLRPRGASASKGKAGQEFPYVCKNGHERTLENTLIRKNGTRLCLECRRESDTRRRPTRVRNYAEERRITKENRERKAAE